MTVSVSRPVKVFALIAVIAGFGGIALLSMHKKPNAAAPVISQSAAPSTPSTSKPATTTPAATQAPTRAKASTKASTRAKHTATVKKAATPQPAIAKNGLPMTIEDALHSHRVVVVSVFDPQSGTDAISYAEARAGAEEAGAGFVGVSLLDSTAAGALTSLLPGGGLLPSPGVLIYRRPDTLVQLMGGFNDRDVVAQAAAESLTASPFTGTSSGS